MTLDLSLCLCVWGMLLWCRRDEKRRGGLYGQEHPGVNERCEKNRPSSRSRGGGKPARACTHTHSPSHSHSHTLTHTHTHTHTRTQRHTDSQRKLEEMVGARESRQLSLALNESEIIAAGIALCWSFFLREKQNKKGKMCAVPSCYWLVLEMVTDCVCVWFFFLLFF